MFAQNENLHFVITAQHISRYLKYISLCDIMYTGIILKGDFLCINTATFSLLPNCCTVD